MDIYSQMREKGTIPSMRTAMSEKYIYIRITLMNGYIANVKIPIVMNINMLQERFSIEITILQDGNNVYDNNLGYENVRNLGTFNNTIDRTDAIVAIEAEYARLMALLADAQ